MTTVSVTRRGLRGRRARRLSAALRHDPAAAEAVRSAQVLLLDEASLGRRDPRRVLRVGPGTEVHRGAAARAWLAAHLAERELDRATARGADAVASGIRAELADYSA